MPTDKSALTVFGLSQAILDHIIHTAQAYPEIKRLSIFGSRAKGNYKNYSDIDLAVYAPDMSAERYAQFHLALNTLPIIFKMDIVRIDTLDDLTLKNKIIQEEKVIYSNA